MAAQGSTPGTIYEMLLWLHRMGVDSYHGNKVEQYIRQTLKSSLIGKHPTAMTGIQKATNEAKELVQKVCKDAGKIIVTIQKGEAYEEQKHKGELDGLQQESGSFQYPDGEKEMFERFVYYFSCCYWQLEFLYKLCGAKSAVGCWGQCRYDKDGADSSDACMDNKGQKPNHSQRCQHCSNGSGCLQAFLTATDGAQGTGSNLYTGATYSGTCNGSSSGPCTIPPMGFPKEKLPPGNKNGSGLNGNLRSYFSGHNNNLPKMLGHLKLLDLLSTPSQGSSSPTVKVPTSWIAGDFWAFWYQLNKNGALRSKLNDKIKKTYDKGFRKNGSNTPNADYADLNDALSKLLFATHGSDNNHNSLLSLSDCDGSRNNSTNKCGKYLYGLFSDPFHWVLDWFKENIELLTFDALQNLASGLKDKLDKFKQGLEKKDCLKPVNASQCQCIVFCDDTHAELYKSGFTFMSPMSLAVKRNKGAEEVEDDDKRTGAQKRKCSDLKDQLQEVTGNGSALEVFSKLEKFTPQPKGRSDDTGDTLSSVSTQTDKGSRAQKELQQQLCSLENTSVQTDVLSAPVGSLFNSCAATGPAAPTPPQPAQQTGPSSTSSSAASKAGGQQDTSKSPPATAAPRAPNTIYEMLLWLYGLGQSDKKSEKQKLEGYIEKELTKNFKSPSNVSTHITNLTSQAKGLVDKVCTDAGRIILCIQKGQNYDAWKGSEDVEKNKLNQELQQQPFTYEKESKDLYNQFLYYLTCCFWQLRFLHVICGAKSAVGGWGQCTYGQSGPESSDACKDSSQQKNHEQRCQTCSSNEKYSGCLMTFLTETNGGQGTAPEKNIYKEAKYSGQCPQVTQGSGTPSCPVPPMGFDKEKLPNGTKEGSALKNTLNGFFSNTKNLPQLLGQLLILQLLESSSQSTTLQVPSSWSLPHLFAFWAAFKSKWKGQKTQWQQKFNEELKGQGGGTEQFKWKDNPGSPESLLEKLFKTYNNSNASEHSNTSSHNGITTLTNCEVNNGASSNTSHCGKYFHGLLELPFQHVLEQFKSDGLFGIFMNHQTIKNFAEKFKEKLTEFQTKLKGQTCVKETQCTCIAFCDDTHAFLYKNGLTFNSPKSLNGNDGKGPKRKCSDLKDQLEHVLKSDAPLEKLTKLSKEVKPAPAPKPQGRSDDTQNNVQTSSPVKKPEAPKPQGAKPAAVKPATSKPEGKTKTKDDDKAQTGADAKPGPGSTGPGVKPAVPVNGGSGGTQQSGQGSSSGTGGVSPGGLQSAGPQPSPAPAPPTAVASQAANTTTVATPSGPGGGLRSDGASVQVDVKAGDNVVVTVSTSSSGGSARSSSPPQPTGPTPSTTTVTTPTPTGINGVASTSPTSNKASATSPGTVNIRDNNRDGVDFWNTFKEKFSPVLQQLKNTFTKVSKSAIETAVKATAIAVRELNAHHSSLLEPPCNVKECLEWLDRVCTNGNKDCKCQPSRIVKSCNNCMALKLSEAVHALLPGIKDTKSRGSNNTVQSVVREASALFNAIKGPNYHSAYRLTAQWPTCCKATSGAASGAQCSGCKKTDCQCSTASSKSGASSSSSSCDGSCSHRCDVRVCAGIFIAMVPALEKALRELKDKLQKERNSWTKNINQSPVVEFLKHLGYEEKDLKDTKWSQVQLKLSLPVQYLGTLKSSIRDAFLQRNTRRNSTHPCYFQVASGGKTESSQCGASSSPPTCSTPRTVREMLLWLMGLPYCEGYKKFVEKLKEKSQKEPVKTMLASTAKSTSTTASSAQYFIHRQYSAVIFQLPVLFFAVEADVSYLRDTFCQFAPEHNRERLKNISQDKNQSCNNNHVKSFQYPCDGEQLCAMFYDYSYKVHLQLRFLLTMCDTEQKDGGWKHCRLAAGSDGTRAVSKSSIATTGAQDCCSEHNLLCSCPDKRSQRATTVTNCQLLREFLRDCRKEDPKKCVNQDPKKCTTDSVTSNAATRNIFQSACSDLYVSMGFRVPECNHNKNDCCTLICHYTGEQIKGVLSGLVDESKGPSFPVRDVKLSKPLSVVTQWMTALQGQEPRSLGDILDLFRELCVGSNRTRNASTSALGIGVRNGNNGTDRNVTMASVLLEQLGELLKDKYADYHSRNRSVTGADAAQQHVKEIQGALYALLDVMHHRTQRLPPSPDSDSDAYSLVAIMGGCTSDRYNTCTAYVKSLSYGLYHYYSPEFKTQKIGAMIYSDHIIDWLFKWCTALYKGLKELKKRITERCNCCLEASKRNDSECTSIVSCCKCPPELYRCALVLGDPKTLIGNGRVRKTAAKKCSDFIDSVTKVLLSSAPLFRACEAIMNTVYHVLLMASKNRVYTHIVNLERKVDGLSAAQLELIVAFHRYVASAMHCSKKKLMETFLRPLCEHYQCEGCDDECPKRDVEVSVSASSVTTITAVIPQYTAPIIEPFHYRVMTKIECCEDCKGKKCTEGNALCCDKNCSFVDSQVASASCYTFRSALDFHVSGAQCILPVPANLRSAVDWILRITVGDTITNSSNDNIKHLSGAIKSVFQSAGVNITDSDNVQSHLTSLVEGLRTFMGYKDRSTDVINKVKEEKNSVQQQLKKNIDALNNFIGTTNRSQFGTELGIALQKAMFTVAQNGEKKTLKCVVEDLQGKLTEKHTDCKETNCIQYESKYGRARHVSTVLLPEGLSELCDFFDHLQYFAKEWYSIGQNNGGNILQTQKAAAMNVQWTFNGSKTNNNNDYFTKLYEALKQLGACAQQVQELDKNGDNGYKNSSDYRQKISALIEGLKAFGQHIKGCDFNGSEDSNIADPVYAVNGAQRLIEETKKGVECYITGQIRNAFEFSYTYYGYPSDHMSIKRLLEYIPKDVNRKIDVYKSHLDDLKQLCQWLYRMGQLYAHGLKGFVESLVKHLEHIIEVIKWIEKLKVFMNIVMNSNNAEAAEVQQSITAGASTIAKLLSSYVLSTSSDIVISDDKASTYRQLLSDLRLLALDRYTLQVWQDECNDGNCRIKDWITFENGVIRHSAVGDIKQKLSELTGIAFDSNASSAPSPSAPSSTPRNRIHDFHAICVIQKFSYEAPIAELEKSLKELRGIQGQLSAVKGKCNNGGALQDDQTVKEFCTTVTEFLSEPYGIYSFAKFVHTIMGPNVFSAVIGALEELKESDKYNKNGNGNLEKIKGILEVMTEGLDGEKDQQKKEHYKLEEIIKKLTEFIATLKKEYIFCYPVVCGMKSDKDCNAVCPGECDTQRCDRKCYEKSKDASLACSTALVTPSHTSATSTSPMPLLCAHCHLSSSICPECITILARIFITLVPVLSPQLCYLAYQCRLYWCEQRIIDCNPLSSLLNTFGWPRECLSDYYIGIDVPIHGRFVSWLLNKETNSLRLLCDDISTDSSSSPFNTDSPLFKLYHLCVSYYQRRRSLSLTESKSTPPVTPTTVRQILRFFVYLPFSAQFHSLQDVLRSYCSASGTVHFSDLFTTLMMSSAMSAVLLQLIECPQEAFLRLFDDIYTNKEGLYFGTNTETLFYQLCDLSVTLYRGLKVLSLQCGTGASLAGWKDCRLRGVKKDTHSKDTSQASDTQQLQLCASHLCECSTAGAKDSSTTCSVLTTAAPMCLTEASTVSTSAPTQGSQLSTQPSHTTSCPLPLLRYLTDPTFFASTLTVPSALRKVCLNDSCQEMIYRDMAPRGWKKEMLQCPQRDEQQGDRQLEVCDQKVCSSACQHRDSELNCCDLSNCGVSCCHPCCRTQCSRVMCSTVFGHDLFHLLRNFVGHEHDADTLLQFTRYMVAIAAWPPDSLSGYMTFMLRFSDWLREDRNTVSGSVAHGNTSQKKDSNSSVLSSLNSEISLFPGEFDPNCLIEAFVKVTHCEHNNGVAHTALATAPALASHSTATLSDATIVSRSSQCATSSGVAISILRDCKDCQCIIYPLDYEIYDLYLPMYARRYLTWMLHFGPRLHRGMRALEKEFRRHIEERSVSQSGASATDPGASQSGSSQSRTSVQCHASVLQCPFALPELHSSGLHFWDPNRMCDVSCECFMQRLQCSIQDSSPLAEFLSACDSFLWSVRKPFYWLTMALWIVATVYLLFVHLWRLDLARLLSHVIRSRASHLVYPKVLLAAEHSYERYYAQR